MRTATIERMVAARPKASPPAKASAQSPRVRLRRKAAPVRQRLRRQTRAVGSSLIRVWPRSTAIGVRAQRRPARRPAQSGPHPEPSPLAPLPSPPPSLTGRGEPPALNNSEGVSPSSPGEGGGRGREKRAGVMRVWEGGGDRAAVAYIATTPSNEASTAPKPPVILQSSCPPTPNRTAGASSSGQPGGKRGRTR